MAHRLNLAAGQAEKEVAALDVFERTLKNLYWFYKNSPTKKSHLQAVMKMTECEVLELQVSSTFQLKKKWLRDYWSLSPVR